MPDAGPAPPSAPRPARRRRLALAAVVVAPLVLVAGIEAYAFYGPSHDAPSLLRTYWWHRESNPARDGMEIAERAGCFSCHGAGGRGGAPNAGAVGGTVPGWEGAPAMMVPRPEVRDYVRQYIRDGVAERLARKPGYQAEVARALIPMPAYKDVLTQAEIEAVAEAVIAVAGLLGPDETAHAEAARGRRVARDRGCFACHGPDGAGGVRNPGSFKGYIPGWRGKDFDDLVRDDEELRRWILEGGVPRLTEDPRAQRFIERQRIQMPPYRRVLEPGELEALVAYIRWLRSAAP